MQPKRILVVEDDELVAATYREVLQDDYLVELAHSASKAMEVSVAQPPALIILDLRMPEVDGFQLARYFRIQPATASAPILVISAHITDETHARLDVLGKVVLMPKPIVALELKRAIYDMMPL